MLAGAPALRRAPASRPRLTGASARRRQRSGPSPYLRAIRRGFFNSPRVHFARNVLAHAGKSGRRVVAAFIATAFAHRQSGGGRSDSGGQRSADRRGNDAHAAKSQWRKVADQLRATLPKLSALMDEAETDVLAYMTFPAAHRAKLHSVNPLERLNGEIKRRTDVVGRRGLTRASLTVLLAPQRGCDHPPGRRDPARAER